MMTKSPPYNGAQQRYRFTRAQTNGIKKKTRGAINPDNILHHGRERRRRIPFGAGECYGYPDHHFVGGGGMAYLVGRRVLFGNTDVCFDRQVYSMGGVVGEIPLFNMTGSRALDSAAANAHMHFGATPVGYTWHHKRDFVQVGPAGGQCTMQLVISNCHDHIFHHGAVSQWNAAFPGNQYV